MTDADIDRDSRRAETRAPAPPDVGVKGALAGFLLEHARYAHAPEPDAAALAAVLAATGRRGGGTS